MIGGILLVTVQPTHDKRRVVFSHDGRNMVPL